MVKAGKFLCILESFIIFTFPGYFGTANSLPQKLFRTMHSLALVHGRYTASNKLAFFELNNTH